LISVENNDRNFGRQNKKLKTDCYFSRYLFSITETLFLDPSLLLCQFFMWGLNTQ